MTFFPFSTGWFAIEYTKQLIDNARHILMLWLIRRPHSAWGCHASSDPHRRQCVGTAACRRQSAEIADCFWTVEKKRGHGHLRWKNLCLSCEMDSAAIRSRIGEQ